MAEWQERLQKVKSVVLTDFRGLNVTQITELRNRLRERGAGYQVVKNTLLRQAVANIGQAELDKYLLGPTGVAYSYENSVDPAKVLQSFARQNANLKLKAGILEGKVIDAQAVQRLASLPNREVLMARLLASFQFPLTGLVSVLQANLRQLVSVLAAIKQQKQLKE